MSAPSPALLPDFKSRNQKIEAREYRLRLDPERFSPLESTLSEWVTLVAAEACGGGMKFVVDRSRQTRRRTWYLDTTDWRMRRNGFSLRVQERQVHDKPFRITLSEVSQDRYLVAMSSVAARGKSSSEFIEEILPSRSLFVKSAELERRKLPRLDYVDDVLRYFPGVGRHLGPHGTQAVTIGDGTISTDVDYDIGYAALENQPPLRFRLTASYFGTWRLGRRIDGELEQHAPDAVEFSFRYESLPGRSDLERFPFENVAIGRRLFGALHGKRGWWATREPGPLESVHERCAV